MSTVATLEWLDALRHRRFWIVAALLVVVFAITVVDYAQMRGYFSGVTVVPNFFNAFNAYLQALGSTQQSLFILALPVFAALPKGDSIPIERQWGSDSVQMIRVGWRSYVWGKWLGNVAIVTCLMVIGLIGAFAMAALMYPMGVPHVIGVSVPAHPLPLSRGVYENGYTPAFLRSLYFADPFLYVALTSVVPLWATVAMASLATGLSLFVRRPYLALALPVMTFWGMNIALPLLKAGGWMPSTLVNIYLNNDDGGPFTWPVTMLYWLIPFALGAAIVGVAAHRRKWPVGGGDGR